MRKSKQIEQWHRLASGYVLWTSNQRVPGSNPILHFVIFFNYVYFLKIPPVAVIKWWPLLPLIHWWMYILMAKKMATKFFALQNTP